MFGMNVKGYVRRFAQRAGSKLIQLSAALENKEDGRHAQNFPQPPLQDDLYYSDQPISSQREDRFNRAHFAKHIAQTLRSRKDPASIVLGIYGAWGDGKTSVIEMMAEELQTQERIVPIKFNPWIFQSEELLLRGFFATLARGLGKSLPSVKEKIGKLLEDYGSILSLASVNLGGIVTLKAGDAIKGLGKKLSQTDISVERRKIESFLEENKIRVVVFIDDIDRLDKEETHAIFKLVKVSASFRHTSYVLAFDYNVVAASLGERYGEGGQKAGSAFLEKIIQVPLHLPPADARSLHELAFQGVDAALKMAGIVLDDRQFEKFRNAFTNGLEQKLATPRLAKRFGNALLFALPLLKGEVNVIDLMLMEGIRVLYPDVYVFIRDNPDIFLQGVNDDRYEATASETPFSLLFKEKFPSLQYEERKRLTKGTLEALFPRIWPGKYREGWDEKQAKEQKICSDLYFAKYFTYSVPKGQISDNVFSCLLHNFKDLSAHEQDSLFSTFSEQKAMPTLIHRLRIIIEDIEEDLAEPLIYAVARNSSLIPRERGPLFIFSTWMEAGMLIADLILKLGQQSQKKILEAIFQSYSIDFCLEIYGWFRNKNKSAERKLLTDNDINDFAQILATEIMKQDSRAPLYKKYGRYAPSLYGLWQKTRGTQSVQEALKAHLDSSAHEVDLFLNSFIRKGWNINSGESFRVDLDKHDYERISSFLPPEFIAAKLRNIYGQELDSPKYGPEEKCEQHRLTAHQFMHLHRAMKALKDTIPREASEEA